MPCCFCFFFNLFSALIFSSLKTLAVNFASDLLFVTCSQLFCGLHRSNTMVWVCGTLPELKDLHYQYQAAVYYSPSSPLSEGGRHNMRSFRWDENWGPLCSGHTHIGEPKAAEQCRGKIPQKFHQHYGSLRLDSVAVAAGCLWGKSNLNFISWAECLVRQW